MKTLDLNKYGVQEMNATEMRIVEGGSIWSSVKEFFRGYYDAIFCFK